MANQKYQYVRKSFCFDGRRYWVRGTTEAEAIRKQIEMEAKLMEGRIDSASTVKKWAEVWYETYIVPRDITEASRQMYRQKLDLYILPPLARTRLRSVTPTMLQQLLNRQAGGSKSDVGKLRIVIKALFRQAYQNRIIPYDPAQGLQMPRTVSGKHRSLTPDERRALLCVADMERMDGKPSTSGLWVLAMLYCGLRPGETAALTWEDIDFSTGTMYIRQAKEAHSTRIKAPKTAAGVRAIPIPRAYCAQLAATPRTGEYVFPQRDGKTPLTDSSIKRRWATIKKYMDIELCAKAERIKPEGKRKSSLIITQHAIAEDLDLYCLRHTYCTDLQKAGVPINVAKELMGHSDIRVTANIYTHATDESLEMARALIDP